MQKKNLWFSPPPTWAQVGIRVKEKFPVRGDRAEAYIEEVTDEYVVLNTGTTSFQVLPMIFLDFWKVAPKPNRTRFSTEYKNVIQEVINRPKGQLDANLREELKDLLESWDSLPLTRIYDQVFTISLECPAKMTYEIQQMLDVEAFFETPLGAFDVRGLLGVFHRPYKA